MGTVAYAHEVTDTTTTRPRWMTYMALGELQRAHRNPKAHDDAGIAASMARFGYVEAITMDERTGLLVAGHGRLDFLEASRAAGESPPDGVMLADDEVEWLIPVQRGWSSENDDEAEAYLLASNQLTSAGGWNVPDLTPMLADLAKSPRGLDGTGFTQANLDVLIADMAAAAPTQPPATGPGEVRQVEQRAEAGDVWQLGRHRVMVGDCRKASDVALLLDGATVQLAVTSPPYADRRPYDPSSGFRPIPPEEYVAWFAPVAALVAEHLAADGSWVVNIKPGTTPDNLDTELYVLDLVMAHRREWGWHFATEYCWERTGVPKGPVLRLKNQFEPVYQFTRGRWKFRPEHVRHRSDNAIIPMGEGAGDTSWDGNQGHREFFKPEQLVKPRKNGTKELMSSVQGRTAAPGEATGEGWAYPGNRLPTFSGSHEATGHEAAFPVGLPAWFAHLLTDEGDAVYDPFVGSGSTILAADETGRRGYGMELSPRYVDIALDRWERHTSVQPELVHRRA